MKNAFFAYSSEPKYCGEAIEAAITRINASGLIKIESWKQLMIAGKLLINEIFNRIEKCDIFCADLTGMNDNVLFELGYAIAKGKPIWLLLDTSHIESVRLFNELNFLSTVGYSSYSSSTHIENAFYAQKIFEKEDTLTKDLLNVPNNRDGRKALFFLKSQVDTDYSQLIVDLISKSKLPSVIDDAVEAKTLPLSWYIQQLNRVSAVIAEFSSTYRVGYHLQNSKCSFNSGLAIGMGLKVLMLSEKPQPATADLKELLQKYVNKDSCRRIVEPFLEELKGEAAQILFRQEKVSVSVKNRNVLQKLNFGEFIAEHENEKLFDYYVETTHSKSLIKSEHNIVVGRKGTGKTATLYYLEKGLSNDVRNHVCLIKPVNFEIDGLLALLKSIGEESHRGYVIEAIWKFLIYTEITKSLYLRYKDKPLYSITDAEKKLIQFVEEHSGIILADFSSRLEAQLQSLREIVDVTSQKEFQEKITFILHQNTLNACRSIIKNVMHGRKSLVVLIDNLDKSWKKNNDLTILSRFLLGLLGVVGRITRDFKGMPNIAPDFTFHLTIFLRSDIFKYLMGIAREPDKIEFSRLKWDDPEVMYRLVEERFVTLCNYEYEPQDLWDKFITPDVKGVSIKNYLTTHTLPRPRDILFLLNSAKNIAVSRGHHKIQSEDIEAAYKEYSNWIFKSILVENGITISQMEEFMYHLMGEKNILTKAEIKEIIINANLDFDNDKIEYFINHLVSLTVLGREVASNAFDYEFEFDSDTKLKALAKKMPEERYKIHPAFASYLEVRNIDHSTMPS